MTVEKPFKCMHSDCDGAFRTKGDLVRHDKAAHLKLRPYMCHFCGKRFAQASALKTHTNTHTKLKPHRCGINGCKKAFSDPSSCARHRKETHSPDAYCCPSCNSCIKRRSHFVIHLKKHGMIDFDPEDYIKPKSGRHDSANSDSFSTAEPTASFPEVPVDLNQALYSFEIPELHDNTYYNVPQPQYPLPSNYFYPTTSRDFSQSPALSLSSTSTRSSPSPFLEPAWVDQAVLPPAAVEQKASVEYNPGPYSYYMDQNSIPMDPNFFMQDFGLSGRDLFSSTYNPGLIVVQ